MKIDSKIPFNPKKFPLYFGYIILIVGTLGMLLSVPGQTIGVTVFTDVLIEKLDISRFNLSLSYMIGTIISSLFLTKAGSFYDKMGARSSTIIVSILFGLILVFLSQIDKVSVFLNQIIPFGRQIANTFVIMVFSFFVLRFLGQGCLTLFSRNMIQKWFDKRRGFANGIISIAIAYGFSTSPVFFNMINKHTSWNGSWLIMGGILVFVFPVIVFFLYRDDPAECSLKPDGKYIKPKKNSVQTTGKDHSLEEAQKTIIFWVYTGGLALFALFVTAITFHIVSIFNDNNLTQEQAINFFIPAAIISIIVSFIASWSSDYIELKWSLKAMLTGIVLTCVGLLNLTTSYGFMLLIVGHGISNGIFSILISLVWPRFFGLKHLGQISGRSMSFLVFGSAVGPALFGFAKDFIGNYMLAIWFCIVITILLLIFAILYGSPRPTNVEISAVIDVEQL